MIKSSKTRGLAILVAACAVALAFYQSQKAEQAFSLHPLTVACLSSETKEARDVDCAAALASTDLTDIERGEVAFRWANKLDRTDWERAINLYSQAIEFFPGKTSAFYNRGLLLSGRAKDHQAALVDFTEVIDRISPEDRRYAGALANRAQIYRKLDQNNQAMADIKRASAQNPTHRLVLYEKAELLLDLKDFDGALTALDTAITLYPDDRDIELFWSDRAWVKRKLGDLDGALVDIDHAIDLGKKTAGTLYLRGWLNMDKGNWDSALLDFQHSLDENPLYCRSFRRKGKLLEKLKDQAFSDPQEIAVKADEVLGDDPENPDFLDVRFHARIASANFDGALEDINRLLEVSEFPLLELQKRAQLYKYLGQNDLVLSDLQAITRT
ncbi:tetratricopeptide repeat protein [Rhodobacteraceae bacterium B1Z28]|uniref:Tetratricopeptide repeat protein n=1 Tax=Ruegeria haliotis TaxID=2747601 RepID=A0ABX2PTG6_9RHOB|nr:tetratricopeptide repeat protein [Ruegeria haliotis]NVO57462.1 tetratricopeptide repeat protein [Ruegeria haliotis]